MPVVLEIKPIMDAAVSVLKAAGAKEVYAFGSAVHDKGRAPRDIDLAVKGLPSGVFFKIHGRLLYDLPVRVDIIDLDSPSAISRHLQASGELVRVG
jgi:predicted nucleotidyltransferase